MNISTKKLVLAAAMCTAGLVSTAAFAADETSTDTTASHTIIGVPVVVTGSWETPLDTGKCAKPKGSCRRFARDLHIGMTATTGQDIGF